MALSSSSILIDPMFSTAANGYGMEPGCVLIPSVAAVCDINRIVRICENQENLNVTACAYRPEAQDFRILANGRSISVGKRDPVSF